MKWGFRAAAAFNLVGMLLTTRGFTVDLGVYDPLSARPRCVKVGYSWAMVRRPAAPEQTDDEVVPRFLWDRSITRGQLRAILADSEDPRRTRLLAALLREAPVPEVWSWVTPVQVAQELDQLSPFLGRRRDFWRWLIGGWRDLGLLA